MTGRAVAITEWCGKCNTYHPPPCRGRRYVFTNSQRSKVRQKYLQDPNMFTSLGRHIIFNLLNWIEQLEAETDPKRLEELKDWSRV